MSDDDDKVVTISFGGVANDELDAFALRLGVSKLEVVAKALGVFHWILAQQDSGVEILAHLPNGRVDKVLPLAPPLTRDSQLAMIVKKVGWNTKA